MDIIRLDDISVQRDGAWILRNVSWRVRPGEHWALLGRNGAGKTTLLNVVLGYLWPYGGRGSVEVLGHRFGQCDIAQVRREIGWVGTALYDRLYRDQTVLRVALSGRDATMARWGEVAEDERRQAEEVLGRFGCGEFLDRVYTTLSQGERQRVLLARAWLARPRLLILDEPCAGLDFIARETFLQAVDRLARDPQGPTIVYVTHHVDEIMPCFNRLLVLEEGRAAAQGDKEEILSDARMAAIYGLPIRVHWRHGRPSIEMDPAPGRVEAGIG